MKTRGRFKRNPLPVNLAKPGRFNPPTRRLIWPSLAAFAQVILAVRHLADMRHWTKHHPEFQIDYEITFENTTAAFNAAGPR